jgi:formate hydrogenlyase subunit 3/multisubunit Na+/H+ antiporter MnhD subunit
MIKNLIALEIAIPILIGAANFINRKRGLAYFLTLLTVTASFVIAIMILLHSLTTPSISYHFGGWAPPIGIEFKITRLNALFLVVVSSSALLTFLYGKQILFREIHKRKISPFCSVFLICLAGLYGIILTNDFFNLYVFIEIASLATYALISIGINRNAIQAAFYYLIIGTIGATLILIGIGYLYIASGTLNIDDFIKNFAQIKHLKTVKLGYYLIFMGLFIKSGLFPFHSWLVKAYKNTNSFILPFLGSISTKVYILILLKLIYLSFGTEYILHNNILQPFLIVTGVLAITVASIIALYQKDLRSMLAFSSISQIGYIFIAISIGTKASMIAAIIFILSHIIAKMALFMVCGHIYYYKNTYNTEGLYMLFKEMPYTVVIFLINAASLIGIPLTFGFVGKISLISSLIEQKMWFVLAAVVIASFITFKYFWNFSEVFLFYKKYMPKEQAATKIEVIETKFSIAPILVFTLLTFINIGLGLSFNKILLAAEKLLI